jgi:hypothetical protein
VSGQLHAPAVLPQGKIPWYLVDIRFGEGGSRENPLSPVENRIPVLQPIGCRYIERPVQALFLKEEPFDRF